jgi:PST family polysaccharide transporter
MASGSGLEFVLRLVFIGVLSRILTPDAFGLVAMVMAVMGVIEGVKDLGLASATVQHRTITHELVSNLFWINAFSGALFAASYCILSPLIGRFYDEPRLIDITLALSMVYIWSGVTVQHEALMIRQMRQGELAYIRLFAGVISMGIAIALALSGSGYWALVWREIIRAALVALGVWIRCSWVPGPPRRHVGTWRLLRFGRDISFTALLYGVVSNVDRILVGRLFGSTALGEYRAAQTFILAPLDQFLAPVASVAQSGLSVLQSDGDRYRHYYEKVVFLVGSCTMPVAAFGIAYAEELTRVFLGDAWLGAAPYFRIFAASAFVRPVLGTASAVLISCGQPGRLLAMNIVSTTTLLAFYALGYQWGPLGIAMAHVANPALLLIPNLWFAFRKSPVRIASFFRAVYIPLIASTAMLAGVFALRWIAPGEGDLSGLIFGFAAAAMLYLTTFILVPRGRSEVRQLVADLRAGLRRG